MSVRTPPVREPAAVGTRPFAWPWAVVALLVAVIWAPTTLWMVDRWSEDGGYYLHGFAVPPAAIWLAWRRRDLWTPGDASGRVGAWSFLVLGALIQCAAVLLDVHVVSAVGLVVCLHAIVLLVGGRSGLRAALPGLTFLWFMVPLPMAAVAQANLELKLAAAEVAVQAARALGLIVVRDGATIALPGGITLLVGTVCSGLRFMVSLTALGALVAFLSDLSRPRRVLLFALALPVAFLSNVLRILGLVLITAQWGAGSTRGMVHDVSGGLVFAVSLAALFGLERLLQPRRAAAEPHEVES